MTPRGPRKLEQPEALKVVVECGRFDITGEERSGRPGYVMLRRWRPKTATAKGQWQRRAIGEMVVRDGRGAVLESAKAAIKDAAMKWYLELTGEIATAPVDTAKHAFTIGEAWKAISNEDDGKYPHRSPFRDELQKALAYAGTVWGEDTAWTAIDSGLWTKLIRTRIRGLVADGKQGIRATEITVSRLITVARWLHRERKVEVIVAPSDDWRDGMLAYWKGLTKQEHDPEPHQPRYTLEESRKLILAARDVDPRVGLLVSLGAELRLGQVRRCRRSDLDLSKGEYGQLEVRGSGDKKGETIELTRGQRAAVDRSLRGHLRVFEESFQRDGTDYPLFPGGLLYGRAAGDPHVSGRDPDSLRPMGRAMVSKYWDGIEYLVGITHVRGRGPYGIRRAAVDEAEAQHLSEAGLQALGGWTTPDVPRRIYRDKANKAGRSEAKKLRAHIRQEGD